MEPREHLKELVSAEGRNRKAVLCQRCGSRVLQPGTALFSRRQLEGHMANMAVSAGFRVAVPKSTLSKMFPLLKDSSKQFHLQWVETHLHGNHLIKSYHPQYAFPSLHEEETSSG
ncbi:guanine nucleotide exchange factor MSS4 isoform X2 [Tamandua tetradactyla]|uniref:guanine nucleotide exchange factor MSS4 isoform X2 n=1 Tax=Tamandua tetradactyla TaxID=48850 RepID=UPI004054976C